ncbi:MAG: hypothetical protein NUV86_02425 [Candidatus Scalindua sp.]|nr:hypothetical protein [Candidatus Scalindua sp.]
MMEQSVIKKKINQKTLKEINLFLEEFYPESKKAADAMVEVKLKSAQARGLETLVATTTRFSEIINYVKRQTGKDNKKDNWAKTLKKQGNDPDIKLGTKLIKQLEKLEEQAESISKEDDVANCLDIKLRLARGWVTQVVCHYLYGMKTADEGGKKNKNDNE